MLKRDFILYLISLFFSGIAFASPDQNNSAPSLPPIQQISNDIKIFGYVDASYNYLLRSHEFISHEDNRMFDLAENGFTLQQAAITIAKQPDQGLGGLVNAILGRDANEIPPNGYDPDIFDAQNFGFLIPEIYLQYTSGSITVYAGELLSPSGLEQYDYTLNTNFSRSILFAYAEPGSSIGFKVSNKFNDQLNLFVGIGNGWNTIRHASRMNTLDFGGTYTYDSTLSLTIDGYAGPMHMTDTLETGPTSQRYLIDVFGTWSVTDQLSFAMNYDYGTQNKATLPAGNKARAIWQGIAGYVNYKVNEKWRTSVRGEIFADSDGYRTDVKQNWREITLTIGYFPIKNLEFRAETRHDFSNVNSFFDKNKINTSNNQQSYALEALYQFG